MLLLDGRQISMLIMMHRALIGKTRLDILLTLCIILFVQQMAFLFYCVASNSTSTGSNKHFFQAPSARDATSCDRLNKTFAATDNHQPERRLKSFSFIPAPLTHFHWLCSKAQYIHRG